MALILLHHVEGLQSKHLKSMSSPKTNQNNLSKSQLPLKMFFCVAETIFKGVSFLTALYPDTNRKGYGAGLTAK
jgi:hypothetical protein